MAFFCPEEGRGRQKVWHMTHGNFGNAVEERDRNTLHTHDTEVERNRNRERKRETGTQSIWNVRADIKQENSTFTEWSGWLMTLNLRYTVYSLYTLAFTESELYWQVTHNYFTFTYICVMDNLSEYISIIDAVYIISSVWLLPRNGTNWNTSQALKVQSAILIPYTFCQIQRNAPHSH